MSWYEFLHLCWKFYLNWTTVFWDHIPMQGEALLICFKAYQGRGWPGRLPFLTYRRTSLFWASIQDWSSRTLTETIDKWVLLIWVVRTLWEVIITDKTTNLKICIPMCPAVAYCNNNKMEPCVTFSGTKEKKSIRLHSSILA